MDTQMVRTTVYMPVELAKMAKDVALERNTTLTKLMNDGLKTELGIKIKTKKKKFSLRSYHMGNYTFRRADAYE